MVCWMSTRAVDILRQIQELPPEERDQVREAIVELQQRQHEWDEQRAKLRQMQSRHAGRGLLNRLLEERTRERARG
jgi:hypothetical protein